MTSQWDPTKDLNDPNHVVVHDDMRRRCPVAYSEQLGYSVFTHADVVRVLEDHQRFSNAVSNHLSVPNGMDPPEHTSFRRMIEQYFSPQRVDTFRPVFRAIADDLITAAVSSGTVEVMNHLARRFASRVQCAFLGWPSEMEQPLIEWTLENSRASHDGNREKLNELAKRFQAIVDRQLDLRSQTSGQPAQDITAELMRERVHNRPLSHEEISSILRNWTVGEIGTISASIGILMHHLAVHPDDQVALRSETELLPQAIDEILRVHNPLFSNRRVTRCPVELGPYKLKAGERVTLHWIAANRDEAVFPKADEVQFDRDATRNLLYGAGVHVCPGAPLARMELREFMASLLAQTSSWQLSKEFIPVYASMPESGFCELQVVLLA